MAQPLTTIAATIDRVNGQGFQIREEPGKWLNVSKFTSPIPTIPPAGTPVAITLDGKGFVRTIEPAERQNETQHMKGSGTPAKRSDRDTTITRLAVLKAAAEFLAARSEAKSTDVVRVAEMWEGWVTR